MLEPVVFGLNYQTADIELRDSLAFSNDEIPSVLERLLNSGVVKEALLLSTCNRTELYFVASDSTFVINAICDMRGVCPRLVREHSYVLDGIDCVRHLFRVISGLESMVLGETEIIAQIKSSMDIAKKFNCLGTNLSGVFQMALAVEKEVRSHTSISSTSISMGNAVANYVSDYIDNLPNRNVLFIGAGQMMQQILPHFSPLSLNEKLIINRTVSNAEKLSDKINAKVDLFINLKARISDFSVVIICSASNTPFIDEDTLDKEIINNTPKLIIDLSMPRVIHKNLKQYSNFSIFTIDDIAKQVDVGLEKRKLAAIDANDIIVERLNDYNAWLRKRVVTPLIKKLRDHSEEIRLDSLRLAEKQLLNGDSPNDILQQLSIQLTNRLLHSPTVNICKSEGQLKENLDNLLGYLYGFEE